MSSRAVRRGLITLAIVFIAGLLAYWTESNSPSFQQCLCDHRNPTNTNNSLETSTTSFSTLRDCTGIFIDLNNGSLTAIATFLLVVATAGLIWTTFKQGDTSRKQLRAYVLVEIGQIELIAVTKMPNHVTHWKGKTKLEIHNTGQTPAQEMSVFGDIDFQEWKLPLDKTKLKAIDYSGTNLSKDTVGPGGFRDRLDEIQIDRKQWEQLRAGTHAIFVYGEIRYKDVFGERQTTHYRFFTGGPIGLKRGVQLAPHDNGNKAT